MNECNAWSFEQLNINYAGILRQSNQIAVFCVRNRFSTVTCLVFNKHPTYMPTERRRLICTSTHVKPFWLTSNCCALNRLRASFSNGQTQWTEWTENVIVMFGCKPWCARLDTNNKSHDHAKTMHNNSKNKKKNCKRNLQGKHYLRLSLVHTIMREQSQPFTYIARVNAKQHTAISCY